MLKSLLPPKRTDTLGTRAARQCSTIIFTYERVDRLPFFLLVLPCLLVELVLLSFVFVFLASLDPVACQRSSSGGGGLSNREVCMALESSCDGHFRFAVWPDFCSFMSLFFYLPKSLEKSPPL